MNSGTITGAAQHPGDARQTGHGGGGLQGHDDENRQERDGAGLPGDREADMQGHGGSLRTCLTGFVLAAILTIAAFWLVMDPPLHSRTATIVLVLALAVVQMAVHIRYFLHLDTRSEGGWNMLAFIFSGVLVLIVLGASIWVMYHEDQNMMPRAADLQSVLSARPALSAQPAMSTQPDMRSPDALPRS